MRQVGQYVVAGTHLRGQHRVHLAQAPQSGEHVLILQEQAYPAGTPSPSYAHPNLLAIREVCKDRRGSHTVLALPVGTVLDQILTERQTLPEPAALAIAIQVSDALEHLHRQQPPIIMACLGPRWVRVDDNGYVTVNFLAVEPGLTTAGLRQSELGFVAPEALDGTRAPTAQADIYSLGMLLAAMTGLMSPTRRRLHGGPLAGIIEQATARDPAQRYQSGLQMRKAMDQRQAQLAFQAALPPVAPSEPEPEQELPPAKPTARKSPKQPAPAATAPKNSRGRRRAACQEQPEAPAEQPTAPAVKPGNARPQQRAKSAPADPSPRCHKGGRKPANKARVRYAPIIVMSAMVAVLAGLLLFQIFRPQTPAAGSPPATAVGPGPWGEQPGMGARAPAHAETQPIP